MSSQRRKKNSGFTLIELIVVIAIIGILVAIAVPRFDKILRSSKVVADKATLRVLNNATVMYSIDHSNSEDIFEGITENEKRMNTLVDNECLTSVVTPQVEDEFFYWHINSQQWLYSLYQVAEVGSNVYDFTADDFNLEDYDKTHTWTKNDDESGISSSFGFLFIPNNNEEYTITTSAQLDEGSKGGYGILFETALDNDNKETGYVLQFDRGLNAIAIKERTDGGETKTIKKIDNSEKAEEWWTEKHNVKLQVTKGDGTDDKKAITVWVDDTEVLNSFPIDATSSANNNFTGLRSWGVQTNYESLTIE